MWQFFFWLSVGVVLYCYAGYPLVLLLLDKFKSKTAEPTGDDSCPSLCLVISAFNEEKVLRKKIENSLSLDYPRDKYSIVVASDGSTDGTVRIAEEYRAQGVRLRHWPVRAGKSAALNNVVRELRDDVVVFTDANSLFAEDALLKLVRHFRDEKIGCVVGKLRYVDRHTTSVGKGESLYWKYEGMISVLESALKSVLVANGSIFAIKRHLFTELYPEVANDFQLPTEIAHQGYGVIYDPEAIALERLTVFWQEEFQRKVRIVLRGITGFSVMRHKFEGMRLWQFFSHKLLRWSIAPFMFLALLSSAMLSEGSALYMTFFALQVVFYMAAVNGWRVSRTRKPQRLFYLPFYFTMVNFAASVALFRFVTGRRQAFWEKAESTRLAPVRRQPPATPAHEVPAEGVDLEAEVVKN